MIKVRPRLRALPERIRYSPRHVLFSNKNTFLFLSMEFYLQNGRNPISIELLPVFFSPIRLIRADRNTSVLAGGKIWCLNQYRRASKTSPRRPLITFQPKVRNWLRDHLAGEVTGAAFPSWEMDVNCFLFLELIDYIFPLETDLRHAENKW